MDSINTGLLSELQRHFAGNLPNSLKEALCTREYQHLVLNQHAIVSIADKAGNITHVNDKFCEISGYTREELTGHNHRLLKSGVHPPEFYRDIWHAISAGKIWQGEICNRRRDGSLYWVASTITPFLDAEGIPYQYVSIRTDISHVKAIESALKESEERHRLALASAQLGSWDWNIHAGKMLFDERWAEIRGYRLDEIEPDIDFWKTGIHPEDMQVVNKLLEEHLAGGSQFFQAEYRAYTRSGAWIWILNCGAVTGRDAKGAPLRMTGTEMDITERKQGEIRQARSLKELAYLKTALDQHAIVVTTDAHGAITHANDKFCEISKYAREELIGKDHRIINSGYHPNAFFEDLWQTISSGRVWKGEIKNRAKDGAFYWVRSTIVPIVDQRGKPVQYIAIRADITDRKQAEQLLIIARDEADRANAAKSQFLSNMSHELRTPMNSILGFAQLMAHGNTLSVEHRDFVSEILKAGDHLLRLINDVLDLAKIESGHMELSLGPVEVCSVVDECLSLIGNMADKRNIQMSHRGLNGVMVRADRTRLRQALLNLLANAVKYNREGGSVKLDVQHSEENRLRILVTDTGPGISEMHLKELFLPFNRLDAENSGIEGTGIGLTITRRIVEMMGGSVDVASEIGIGSTFWIELPRETADDAFYEQGKQAAISRLPTINPDAAQRTLLYIEDNPSNIKLVSHFFGQRKHIRLLTARTPELGIEMAKTRNPDLILLDINMPGMDGYEVLNTLQAEARLHAVPVVAVTANAMAKDIARARAAGFADYLTKPLDMFKFHAVVDRLLESKKS